jgi:hypothetical protein
VLVKETLGELELSSFISQNTLDLPAIVVLHLATGKADWINGRCVCSHDAVMVHGVDE